MHPDYSAHSIQEAERNVLMPVGFLFLFTLSGSPAYGDGALYIQGGHSPLS